MYPQNENSNVKITPFGNNSILIYFLLQHRSQVFGGRSKMMELTLDKGT